MLSTPKTPACTTNILLHPHPTHCHVILSPRFMFICPPPVMSYLICLPHLSCHLSPSQHVNCPNPIISSISLLLCHVSPSSHHITKLPACTTATAHTLAFEFDLVMDLMAIFSNKQTEVSTGEKTYDMTVYEIWKHAAWSKPAVKSWLYVEHPVGWMLFAWHFFNHHLDTEKRLSTTTMRWLGKPQQKTNLLSVLIHSTILYH